MIKKYKSRYGADSDITAAQYLVEFMMERIAKREKTTLPFKFWKEKKWINKFRMQVKYANELFAEYSEEEVFKALNTKQGKRILSLGAKKTMIAPLIEEARKYKVTAKVVTGGTPNESGDIFPEDIYVEKEVVDCETNVSMESKPSLWSKLK